MQAGLAGIKACAVLPGATPLCLQVSTGLQEASTGPFYWPAAPATTPGQLMEWGSCPSSW